MTLAASRAAALAAALTATFVAGSPLHAQTPDSAVASPRAHGARFAGEWLQANGGPIDRHALPSLAATVSRRLDRGVFSGAELEVGWLRAARPTTTAQGVTAGLARALRAGPLTLRPAIAALAGQALSTVDSGGYDWRGINAPYLGQTGYQDRPRLTRGATVGAGLQLGADVALYRGLHLTGSVRQWTYTGRVIAANRSPLLAGFGLAFDRAARNAGSARASGAIVRPTVSAIAPEDTAR